MEEAKAYAQRQEIEAGNAGARAASVIGDGERRTLLHAQEALAPYGKTITEAVAFYLEHLRASERSATVAAVIAELLAFKATEGKAARYQMDLRSRLGRFERDFGARPMSALPAAEISTWLAGLNLEATGANNFRRVLAVLFNFGAARGYCPAGIMRQTVRMKASEAEPGILTVAECAALLHGAPDAVRAGLAIALFCGVRDAELYRLDWRAVDLDNETVAIGPQVSKRSQRRTIPIRANLRAWLEPLRQLGGPVIPSFATARPLIAQARRAAGFTLGGTPWPHNALRHSYASYRLAAWPDAAALALEMGNSPAIILRHYRSLVKPAAAEAFWNLAPETAAAKNVVTMGKEQKPAPAKRTKSA